MASGRNDQALTTLSEMEDKGLSPNEASLRALIRGFAAEGVGDGKWGGGGVGLGGDDEAAVADRRWKGVENALGVFEELAEKFHPPSRCVLAVFVVDWFGCVRALFLGVCLSVFTTWCPGGSRFYASVGNKASCQP